MLNRLRLSHRVKMWGSVFRLSTEYVFEEYTTSSYFIENYILKYVLIIFMDICNKSMSLI